MVPGFRKTNNSYELYSKIVALYRQKTMGMFWQTSPSGQRKIFQAKIIRVSQAEKMVIAQIFSGPKDFNISKEIKLNAYFEDIKFLFSISGHYCEQDLIYFELPTLAFAPETRSRARSSLRNLKGDLIIEFALGGRGQVSTSQRLRLLDLSPTGAGMIDPGARTKAFLRDNDVITIQRLCGQSLDRPLVAKIVYLKDIIDPRTEDLRDIRRIGIKFYREIDPYTFILPFLDKE